jgi:two-component system chemotaxis response regulator CheB
LENCFERRRQPEPQPLSAAIAPIVTQLPFVGVCIAASTGGPQAVNEVFQALGVQSCAAFFVVQHGPAWMFEVFSQSLQRQTSMKVNLAEDGAQPVSGEIYVAPGEQHLVIAPRSLTLRLLDEPPVNYIRPAADPLFRSAAEAFGPHCIGVVMTGMGRDASLGASHVASAGGVVLVQDPKTAVVPSMPQTVIDLGIAREVVPLSNIGTAISRYIDTLSAKLKM